VGETDETQGRSLIKSPRRPQKSAAVLRLIRFSVPMVRIAPSPRLIRLAKNASSSSGIRRQDSRVVTRVERMSSRRNGERASGVSVFTCVRHSDRWISGRCRNRNSIPTLGRPLKNPIGVGDGVDIGVDYSCRNRKSKGVLVLCEGRIFRPDAVL
jgi:hypothetical protein